MNVGQVYYCCEHRRAAHYSWHRSGLLRFLFVTMILSTRMSSGVTINMDLWLSQSHSISRAVGQSRLWTASTVDQILAEGDRFYLDALVSRSIPDTETLSLNYLPSVARCCVDSNTNNMQITTQTNYSLLWAESQTNDLLLPSIYSQHFTYNL